jgi:hypothetical protein
MASEASTWSPKDPSDIADYWFDWGSDEQDVEDRFLPEDEVITTAVITVPTAGQQPVPTAPFVILTKVDESDDDKTVRVRLAGGIPGINYNITCLITTVTGQQFEQTKILPVRERIK